MNRPTRFIPFSLFALTLALAAGMPATAIAAGFIKIAGIEGETRDAAHSGEVEVLSFQWGAETSAAGASSTSRKRQHDWITITKRVDKATPKLAEAVVKGKVFPSMTLFLPDPDKTQAYLKYELENVLVTSYSVSGDAAGGKSETFTLNYEKKTQEQKAQGKAAKEAPVRAATTADS